MKNVLERRADLDRLSWWCLECLDADFHPVTHVLISPHSSMYVKTFNVLTGRPKGN